MKKLSLVCAALVCITMQSCSGGGSNDDDETKPLKAPKPMVIIDNDAALFVKQAVSMGLYEITLDKLAVTKGDDKRVKNFGNVMAKEHIKAINKLTEIAKGKKIPVPDTLTTLEQNDIDQLLKNQGKAFDRAYMDDMAKNHEDAIKLFATASKQLMDPELRSIAGKNVPNLKRHLDVVNMIRASMK